jgi:flagellar motor switch protein FliG
VAGSGARKAAMLLMSLDPASAAELLKEARPEVANRIVAELASLGASPRTAEAGEPAQEFLGMLTKAAGGGAGRKFLKELLDTAMGKDRSKEMLSRLEETQRHGDPFHAIRGLDSALLAKALQGESPQVVALVLSDLPAKKSTELVGLLDESVRVESLRGIAAGEEPSPEVRKRVADLVLSRVSAPTMRQSGRRDHQMRKVALLLRGLEGEMRGKLLQSMAQSDPESGKAIQDAMVTWEDIVAIADRSLQEVMRGMESRKLAMALVGAEAAIVAKLRTAMSERAAAMLEEEMSLLSAPKASEIAQARQAILTDLRELNANNMLSFVEG